MGQVYVRASRRAKAHTRKKKGAPTARLTGSIVRFTPGNKTHLPSAIRAMRAANKFIGRGHGTFGQRRHLVAAAKLDRANISKALKIKKARGFRTSAYK